MFILNKIGLDPGLGPGLKIPSANTIQERTVLVQREHHLDRTHHLVRVTLKVPPHIFASPAPPCPSRRLPEPRCVSSPLPLIYLCNLCFLFPGGGGAQPRVSGSDLGLGFREAVAREALSNLSRVCLLFSVASGCSGVASQQVRGLGSWIYGLSPKFWNCVARVGCPIRVRLLVSLVRAGDDCSSNLDKLHWIFRLSCSLGGASPEGVLSSCLIVLLSARLNGCIRSRVGGVGGSNLQSSFSVRRHRRLQIPPRGAGVVLLG
ncbi:hypothetical protein F2Q70_00035430 [Brassica cretica]|uniref:Uncharacterized protein n=1 Tax=Brassica cretica TaxID=69181 RepID=A0A8S9JQV4_BRACR|nr:hypothetical protein F2Q70_00035430 [Brassica cretica]